MKYEYTSNEKEKFSLHDCRAVSLKMDGNSLDFYFPDGIYYEGYGEDWPNTGRAEVSFKLIPQYTIHFYTFEGDGRESVRKFYTVRQLADKLASGEWELEFAYRYDGYREIMYTCWIWQNQEPWSMEAQLFIASEETVFNWDPPRQLIIATNNKGKVREYKDIFEPLGYAVFSQGEKGIDLDVEETGTTFEENAALKARAVYDIAHCAVISDDSGLEVEALNWEPGIYSARYKGLETEHERRMAILEGLKDKDNRNARFVCCICYIDAQGEQHLFKGIWKGQIGEKEEGTNGFGYDPIFISEDADGHTTASLPISFKETYSHRAKAVRLLMDYLHKLQEEEDSVLKLAQYDNKCVRLVDSLGNVVEGVASYNSQDYNEHEYGRDEDGLQLASFLFFRSDITEITSLEEVEGPYGHFSGPYGWLEEQYVEEGAEGVEELLDSEDEVHISRLLTCLEDHLKEGLPEKEEILDLIRMLVRTTDNADIKKQAESLLKKAK